MRQRGFTLVEMLISATLMLIVLGTSMYGYQLYMQYWQREQQQQEQQFAAYRSSDLLYGAVRGIVPYAVKQGSVYAFYFLGRDNGFTAVTTAPIFNPGAMAVIRVFREQLTDGVYQLVYEEASLAGLLLMQAEQQLPFNHRLVLPNRYRRVNFAYQQTLNLPHPDFPEQLIRSHTWLPAFDGMQLGSHPSSLQLQLDDLTIQLSVADRQNLLLRRYQQGDLQ